MVAAWATSAQKQPYVRTAMVKPASAQKSMRQISSSEPIAQACSASVLSVKGDRRKSEASLDAQNS